MDLNKNCLPFLPKPCVKEHRIEISAFSANGSGIVFDFADNHLFTSELPKMGCLNSRLTF